MRTAYWTVGFDIYLPCCTLENRTYSEADRFGKRLCLYQLVTKAGGERVSFLHSFFFLLSRPLTRTRTTSVFIFGLWTLSPQISVHTKTLWKKLWIFLIIIYSHYPRFSAWGFSILRVTLEIKKKSMVHRCLQLHQYFLQCALIV